MNIKNFTLTGVFVSLVTIAAAQERLSDGTDKSGLTINQNAILELASRNKGLLHTRIALEMTTKAAPMQDHVAGLMVFNTEMRNDVVPGIYYNDGTKWVLASSGKATSISYDPSTYEISFIDINGNPVTLNFKNIVKGNETVTSLIDNGDGTYVYTSEAGLQTTINVTGDVSNKFEQIIKNENVKNEIVSLIKSVGGNIYYDGNNFTYLTKEGDTKTISIKEIVSAHETLTVLGYDKPTNQLTYKDEKGVANTVDLGTGSLTYDAAENRLTYTDATGTPKELILNTTNLRYDTERNALHYTNTKGLTESIGLSALVTSNETLTVLGYDKPTNQLTYKDEKGVANTVDLGTGSLTYDAAENRLTYTDATGTPKELILNTTNLRYDTERNALHYTNTKGLTESIGLSALVTSNETLTSLDQDATGLQYKDEKGVVHKAKIVSANTANIIKVDGDFGALLIAEDIHANQEKTTVSGGKGTVVTLEENNNTKNYKVEVTDDLIKILKSAMPKFFYMPSMVMPTSKDQISDPTIMEENAGVFTIKLYNSYTKQFNLTDASSSAVNAGRATKLPVLPANQLDYYVTFYDKTVFEGVSISNEGDLSYRIKQDADITIGSFMNIVFAVRP
ncbi:hypothetical protein [Sphingobacterium luzhongxinii]|uniref:hypothetical protein n=1 Tax=Sphingobacterium luzhongxinii TaxID=2654181 RepID=UPI0013DC4A91|nr:hypothetical protein [Sphingobacterium sp. xlx-183]